MTFGGGPFERAVGRVSAVRREIAVRYGSSPRGAQALMECARVAALIRGRCEVALGDVRRVARAVLRHRIILNFDAHADRQTPETILTSVLDAVNARALAA